MPTSELIYLLHWTVYTWSVVALILLFTNYRKIGATWITILFGSQALFNGCIIVVWQNYYRVQEGLQTIKVTMLTDRFSADPQIQIVISVAIAILSGIIVINKVK